MLLACGKFPHCVVLFSPYYIIKKVKKKKKEEYPTLFLHLNEELDTESKLFQLSLSQNCLQMLRSYLGMSGPKIWQITILYLATLQKSNL